PSPACARGGGAGGGRPASAWWDQASLLRCLPGLALDDLAGVAHALSLVGLGLAHLADVGRHLADDLLVDASDGDARGCRHFEGDAFGRLDHDGMTEAKGQLEARGALGGGPVPDADDLEVLGETVGDANDHVVDE